MHSETCSLDKELKPELVFCTFRHHNGTVHEFWYPSAAADKHYAELHNDFNNFIADESYRQRGIDPYAANSAVGHKQTDCSPYSYSFKECGRSLPEHLCYVLNFPDGRRYRLHNPELPFLHAWISLCTIDAAPAYTYSIGVCPTCSKTGAHLCTESSNDRPGRSTLCDDVSQGTEHLPCASCLAKHDCLHNDSICVHEECCFKRPREHCAEIGGNNGSNVTNMDDVDYADGFGRLYGSFLTGAAGINTLYEAVSGVGSFERAYDMAHGYKLSHVLRYGVRKAKRKAHKKKFQQLKQEQSQQHPAHVSVDIKRTPQPYNGWAHDVDGHSDRFDQRTGEWYSDEVHELLPQYPEFANRDFPERWNVNSPAYQAHMKSTATIKPKYRASSSTHPVCIPQSLAKTLPSFMLRDVKVCADEKQSQPFAYMAAPWRPGSNGKHTTKLYGDPAKTNVYALSVKGNVSYADPRYSKLGFGNMPGGGWDKYRQTVNNAQTHATNGNIDGHSRYLQEQHNAIMHSINGNVKKGSEKKMIKKVAAQIKKKVSKPKVVVKKVVKKSTPKKSGSTAVKREVRELEREVLTESDICGWLAAAHHLCPMSFPPVRGPGDSSINNMATQCFTPKKRMSMSSVADSVVTTDHYMYFRYMPSATKSCLQELDTVASGVPTFKTAVDLYGDSVIQTIGDRQAPLAACVKCEATGAFIDIGGQMAFGLISGDKVMSATTHDTFVTDYPASINVMPCIAAATGGSKAPCVTWRRQRYSDGVMNGVATTASDLGTAANTGFIMSMKAKAAFTAVVEVAATMTVLPLTSAYGQVAGQSVIVPDLNKYTDIVSKFTGSLAAPIMTLEDEMKLASKIWADMPPRVKAAVKRAFASSSNNFGSQAMVLFNSSPRLALRSLVYPSHLLRQLQQHPSGLPKELVAMAQVLSRIRIVDNSEGRLKIDSPDKWIKVEHVPASGDMFDYTERKTESSVSLEALFDAVRAQLAAPPQKLSKLVVVQEVSDDDDLDHASSLRGTAPWRILPEDTVDLQKRSRSAGPKAS